MVVVDFIMFYLVMIIGWCIFGLMVVGFEQLYTKYEDKIDEFIERLDI